MSQQEDKHTLATLLSEFMERKNMKDYALTTQVNQRFGCASIGKNTIEHWRTGTNKTTKSWQQLLAIAVVLELSREETEQLLQAAQKCPDLAELERRDLKEAERELLKKIPKLNVERPLPAVQKDTQAPPIRSTQIFSLSQQKISDFTGRKAELEQMEALLLAPQSQPIVGLTGTGGMGKTSLAYHFARTYRDHFPDGVIGLRIDLQRDRSPGEVIGLPTHRRNSAEEIARSFAKEAGVTIDPDSEWHAKKIMEHVFQHKRALLILDNAEDLPTVSALLPDSNTCAVIVTTRHRGILPNLHIPPQARISLEQFSLQETKDLLSTLLDPQTVQAEISAVESLYQLIGGLPLAIRIAGSLLNTDDLTITSYTNILSKEIQRLPQLIDPDSPDERNVRASFAISLKFVTKLEFRLFACLGACSQEGFTQQIALVVSDQGRDTVEMGLSRLYRLSLINQSVIKGEYAFHPLLYVFARDLAREEKILDDAELKHTTYFTMRYIREYKNDFDALEKRLNDFILVGKRLTDQGRPEYEFFFLLQPFLHQRGHWSEALTLIDGFLPIAQARKDAYNTAHLLLHTGRFLLLIPNFDKAEQAFSEGIEIAKQIENQNTRNNTTAKFLNSLATLYNRQERLEEAANVLQESLKLRSQTGDDSGKARDLNELGMVLERLGRREDATKAFQQSYKLRSDDIIGQAIELAKFGTIYRHQHELEKAIGVLTEALNLNKQAKHKRGEAMVLNALGEVYQEQRKLTKAEDAFRQSYDCFAAIQDVRGQATALLSLGTVYTDQNNLMYAETAFEEALAIDKEHKNDKGQAKVLDAWGKALVKHGKYHAAFEKLQASFALEEKLKSERGLGVVTPKLIEVCRTLHRIDEARSYCRRALTIVPHNQKILKLQRHLDE